MSGIRRRRSYALSIAAAATLLLFPTAAQAVEAPEAPSARAAAQPAAAAQAVEHKVPSTAKARAAEYWTPERMAKAVPAERVERTGGPGGRPAPQRPTGPATTGSDPVLGNAARAEGFRATVSATQVVGKVFFTGSDGKDYVCSGSAVNSTNKNMVFTAGHCVHGGPGQSWNSNWQFVPYYDHGSRPYGTWWAETLVAFNGWTNDGNFGYDLGIVITSPNSSGELVNAVGGMGLQWNQSKDRFVTAMGYPQAPPFDGQWQYFCAATSSQRSWWTTDQIKIPCNMTGGSSGGPWIFGKDDNVYCSGWVNGVNSNVDSKDNPTEMRSPYFAGWVGDAFNTYSSY
ncbi:trypsin-like peptidase domain-containing protein [Streptomyces sp. NPDC051079]|uniref:trypsin-like serine peptidase n=1 Tax=Streptomyces sp. NPDC051079 TaxID=3155043 RepID=UPI00344CAD95